MAVSTVDDLNRAPLVDPFGRRIDYLRVSITDRCNFRCVYCMPEAGFPPMAREEMLSFDEIVRLVGVAISAGVAKVRLTGGEPLLRRDMVAMVREIATFQGLSDLSCTTNGFMLPGLAAKLSRAGLHRVNVSLDTLKPERFQSLARRGDLATILAGIDAALDAGLSPLKINVVALKGDNDDEAVDFAEWTVRQAVHVRFIELMPMRWDLDEVSPSMPRDGIFHLAQAPGDVLDAADLRRKFISGAETRANIESRFGALEPASVATNGPAITYRIPGAPGTIGFISQISADVCSRCNRLRLTADGFLRPCLMEDGELDIKACLRSGATDAELTEQFRTVVRHKPARHYLAEGQQVRGRGMSQIGG